jgi:hypothetical protein
VYMGTLRFLPQLQTEPFPVHGKGSWPYSDQVVDVVAAGLGVERGKRG